MSAFTVTSENFQHQDKVGELVLAYQERRNALVELGVITTGLAYRNWQDKAVPDTAFPAEWVDSATPTSLSQGTYIQGMDLFKEMQEFVKDYCGWFADATTGKEHTLFGDRDFFVFFTPLAEHCNNEYDTAFTADGTTDEYHFTRQYSDGAGGVTDDRGYIEEGDYISETVINELVACFSAMNVVSADITVGNNSYFATDSAAAPPSDAYAIYGAMKLTFPSFTSGPNSLPFTDYSYGTVTGFADEFDAIQDQDRTDAEFPVSIPEINFSGVGTMECVSLSTTEYDPPDTEPATIPPAINPRESVTVEEFRLTSTGQTGIVGADYLTILDSSIGLTATPAQGFFTIDRFSVFCIDPKFSNIGIAI